MKTTQFGLSLIELMIVLALSTLFMLGITRYSVDSVQTDRVAFAMSENQDSVRTAMDMLRQDVMMGGFKGCNSSAIAIEETIPASNDSEDGSNSIDWQDRMARLESGVVAVDGGIDTARLIPFLNPNPDIILSDDLLTISLPKKHEKSGFPKHDDTDDNQLILANCNNFQLIDPPAIKNGAKQFTLQIAVSPEFFNRAEGSTMPSTRLYSYQESRYRYSDFIYEDEDENHIGGPSLWVNDEALITGLQANGLAIEPNATTTRFSVRLNMQTPMQKDNDDNQPKAGVYQSNMTALNRRLTQ
ncbi:PilW family protein [Sansalvadorimonas verongulae]|uniref:PilW family protein n=1 Tax=Sansalvadorimonas verongulae TaxID=2172824 RepID=UPI0012BB6644|nr:hypothetical protein [Sansalvadorimonas verongulae]MTI14990.1 hypothetical protein [Sansalvadorimonas verongulae]